MSKGKPLGMFVTEFMNSPGSLLLLSDQGSGNNYNNHNVFTTEASKLVTVVCAIASIIAH